MLGALLYLRCASFGNWVRSRARRLRRPKYFFGAVVGGYLYSRWAAQGVVIADAVLLVIWLVTAFGLKAPEALSTRTYSVPALDAAQTERLVAKLRALPGVREARVVAAESIAYLKVDSARFDEHNVLHIIAGEGELTWPPSTR